MSIDQYLDIRRPEEKTILKVKADPVEALSHAFRMWAACVEKVPEYDELLSDSRELTRICDLLLAEAEHTSIALPQLLADSAYFIPIDMLPFHHTSYAGLFYTALLNNGKIDKLVVPDTGVNISFWGYRLSRGTIEIYDSSGIDIGTSMSGGTIITKGNCENMIGHNALGGVFINNGECWGLSSESQTGIFINKKTVEWFCNSPVGGVFINKGRARNIDIDNTNYLLVNYGSVKKIHTALQSRRVYQEPFIVYNRRLLSFPKSPSELRTLLDEMHKATKGYTIDEKKVYDIAEKIKGCLHGN